MTLQWRRKEPRAGGRDPFYTIERDIAYIGSDLVRAAMYALDEQYYEDWFKEFFGTSGLTEVELVQGAEKFCRAFNKIITAEDPPTALAEAGFSDMPYYVQLAIYCMLGQVLLAAIWAGVKDVSKPDSDPPVTVEELLEDVCNVAKRFNVSSDILRNRE